MIEELLIFLGILICSLVIGNIALKESYSGPFYHIAIRLAFVGVVVHECCHYVMNLAVGIRPEHIEIRWREEKTYRRNPHGSVQSKPRNFLQAFVICLAPLYISTWLIFLSITVMLSSQFDVLLRIFAGFFAVSLLFGAAPSNQDFNNIPRAFGYDPLHSLYQLVLIGVSALILWGILVSTKVVFFLDVFYYLSIAGIYLILKFSFIAIDKIFDKIASRDYTKPRKTKFRKLKRRRYKPKKPPKIR